MNGFNFQILMHISGHILINWNIRLTNGSHFWRNDFTNLFTHTLILLIETWFARWVVNALNFIIDFNHLVCSTFILVEMLSCILLNCVSSLMIWVLHQIIWFQSTLLTWHAHALRYHVSVILVDWIVLVTIWVNINLIQLMVNLRFEILFDHISSFLSSQLLRKSEQQLIFISLGLLS